MYRNHCMVYNVQGVGELLELESVSSVNLHSR